MPKFTRILLAIAVVLIAVAFNLIDLMSFDLKFSIHPGLYGPAEHWEATVLFIRRVFLLTVGPTLVLALFSEKLFYQIYLPVFFIFGALTSSLVLKLLETNYSWIAYVAPQIKIEKLQKGTAGPNEYVGFRVCNHSQYSLHSLSIEIVDTVSGDRHPSPVLNEQGSGYQPIAPNECYETKAYVQSGLTIENLEAVYGGLQGPGS